VFSDTLDISKSYAFGSLGTVFQTEMYAIFACSEYCRSVNTHNMTICICFDSKAALLALSSYTILSILLHQCWLSLQDLSNNNKMRLFSVPGHCDIKENEEIDWRERARTPTSVVKDMNRKWVIDSNSKHWIVLNSCRQSKIWIQYPKLQIFKSLMSLPKKQLRILVFLITGHCFS
jgi:hypothetical protein